MKDLLHTLLLESEFFRSLSAENRRRVADISVPKTLERRGILFREGERGAALWLCGHGSIQLHKTTDAGQETVIKIIKPGELFAEVVLFELERYPVTALAIEPSLVFELPKIKFNGLLHDDGFRTDFLANLMSKLRYLADQVQALSARDAEFRLFRFLRDRFGESNVIRTSLSKKDVAAAIGATPETLSRLLQRLKDSGRLTWQGGWIRIRP
jgi:CRP/FNR family transcriptional regulator, dissimilatory nitrate respiration regulator